MLDLSYFLTIIVTAFIVTCVNYCWQIWLSEGYILSPLRILGEKLSEKYVICNILFHITGGCLICTNFWIGVIIVICVFPGWHPDLMILIPMTSSALTQYYEDFINAK